MRTLMARTGFSPGTTLTWAGSNAHYSTYIDPDGEEVHLRHGDAKVLVAFEDLDLADLWRKWQLDPPQYLPFIEYVCDQTFERLTAQQRVAFCGHCSTVGDNEDMFQVNPWQRVCAGCKPLFLTCPRCDGRYADLGRTLDGALRCEGCMESLPYCEDCEGIYDPDVSSHNHDECECEPKGMSFRIRNDGADPLRNDRRVTVTLPKGVISDEGLDAIRRSILSSDWYYDPTTDQPSVRNLCVDIQLGRLGRNWQEKTGNFTKRLSRHAYNTYSLSIPPDVISNVGNVAREHSMAVDCDVEVTRDLNLPPEYFAHEESCWWGGETQSRCALKTNGGFALRTFGEPDYDGDLDVKGRAWVMPLRKTDHSALTPTFETENPDAFMVFNGYGDLEGYAPARLLAHMVGMTYRKIGFSCRPMWVNSDSGYLVAPEEIAETYANASLSLEVRAHSNLYETEEEKETADVA